MKRLLAAILNLLCPRIAAGQLLPYGLSIGKDTGALQTDVVRLLLPVGWWRGVDYLPADDLERHGWWLVSIMIAVLRVPGGIDVRLRAGLWARGYGKLRVPRYAAGGSTTEWIDERAFRLWHERRSVPAVRG